MKRPRARDQWYIRNVLEFVNADPVSVYEALAEAHDEAARPAVSRKKAKDFHGLARDALSLLAGLCSWRGEKLWERYKVGATGLNSWSADVLPAVYAAIVEKEVEDAQACFALIRGLGKIRPRGLDLRGPADRWGFPDEHGGFQLEIMMLATVVLERQVDLGLCGRTDCGNFFVEDRNVKDPKRKQKFCCKKCREKWHYDKRGEEYYAAAKRRSRAKRRSTWTKSDCLLLPRAVIHSRGQRVCVCRYYPPPPTIRPPVTPCSWKQIPAIRGLLRRWCSRSGPAS